MASLGTGNTRDRAYADDARRWAAVQRRDHSAAGRFLFGVVTTGVYCRPGCPARLPKRSNTRFFATRLGAERAGFRACKRCKPDQATPRDRQGEIITRVCRLIEEAEDAPRLQDLARSAGVSPCYLHRLFKRLTGVTPRAYAMAERLRRVKQGLRSGGTVTRAMYDAGYHTSSRFYEQSGALLGMNPRQYQRGGADREIRHAVVPCSLGFLLVAATDRGICAIGLGDDARSLRAGLRMDYPDAKLVSGDRSFDTWVEAVVACTEHGFPTHGRLPLDVRGTAFQRRVWEELQRIPPGDTASYSDIARRTGDAGAARAVGHACAKNPVAVLIPCHRAVRRDGSLGGYRWGVERKKKLLDRESGP